MSDEEKHAYTYKIYQDQSARIAWLEKRVEELERQLNETR